MRPHQLMLTCLAAAATLPAQSAPRPTTWVHTHCPTMPDLGGALVNPAFEQGLVGWTVSVLGGAARPGTVTVENGKAVLAENASFLVSLVQRFRVPASPDTFCFDFEPIPGFDRTANGIPDAFEVHLLDDNLVPVVPTWDPLATSFFNMQEDGTVLRGATTTWDGLRATVDVRHLQPGTMVTVFVDLIGGDRDEGSRVRVDNFDLPTCPTNVPPVLLSGPAGRRVRTHAGGLAQFDLTFGPPEQLQNIVRIEVEAFGLGNFTSDPPVLGPSGTVSCRFQPDALQITTGGPPHVVRITAFDDCTTPLSLAVEIDLEVCTCPADAATSAYGDPWPGTLGNPVFTATLPSVCGAVRFAHSNTLGTPGAGCLWLADRGADLPTVWGGRLYVDPGSPFLTPHAYPLPVAGAEVVIPIPCGATALCGWRAYAQAFQLDPGASHGISGTHGIELVLGN